MATIVQDRFQITRHGSGFMCSFARFNDALRFCQEHKCPTELTIFDAMAHIGRPERWDWNGIVFQLRSK